MQKQGDLGVLPDDSAGYQDSQGQAGGQTFSRRTGVIWTLIWSVLVEGTGTPGLTPGTSVVESSQQSFHSQTKSQKGKPAFHPQKLSTRSELNPDLMIKTPESERNRGQACGRRLGQWGHSRTQVIPKRDTLSSLFGVSWKAPHLLQNCFLASCLEFTARAAKGQD